MQGENKQLQFFLNSELSLHKQRMPMYVIINCIK